MSKDIKYVWIKYKLKHAWGLDKEWDYMEMVAPFTKARQEGFLSDMQIKAEGMGDYHYRGVVWKRISHPPKAIIEKRIEELSITSELIANEAKRYKEYLKTFK